MVTSVPFLIAKILGEEDFVKLKELSLSNEDWNLQYEKGGIKIWSRNIADVTIKMFKVWTTYKTIGVTSLYNTLMDPNYRKEWDYHMTVGYDIGHLNANNGISYYAISCPTPLKNRDFVLQTSWMSSGAERFILNHSVCHKDHPPKPNYTRAISYFTGYYLKGLSVTNCELYFVSQTDLQGIIPSWIINRCTQIFAPRFIKHLEKCATRYEEWKKNNDPDLYPWLVPEQITSAKIPIEDCIPCEEELQSPFFRYLSDKYSKFSILPVVRETSVQFHPPGTSKTSDDVNISDKIISKKSEKEKKKEKRKKNKMQI